MLECQQWNATPSISSHNDISKIFYAFYEIYIDSKEAIRQIDITLNLTKNDAICSTNDSLTVVYVIGEAYIKHHSQLYGYKLNTTPRMIEEQQCGNLFAFTNVISPYNYTINTLRNLFSCNDINRHEWWSDFPQFPYLFKLAGYDVTYFDNQFSYNNSGNYHDYSLQDLLMNDKMVEVCYSRINTSTYLYDEHLIVDFFNKYSITNKKNLHVFHLWGQHNAPQDRYPSETFSKFNADSICFRSEPWLTKDKKEWIAAYDNATLYNDYVLGLLFDMFRNKNAVILYHADHGEEMYDYRDMRGRKFVENLYSKDFRHCQYDVPFIIWCSDKYMEGNRDVVSNIKASLDKPYMIDNTCQVLFHLGGIDTRFYFPERDLISTDFEPTDRYMDVVGEKYIYNYDSIVGAR